MRSKSSKKQSATDWERLSVIPDSQIDLTDSPQLDESFFANATLRLPAAKKAVSFRIDSDVLEWFKKQGPGYQTKMNAVLRMYMQVRSGTAPRSPSKRLPKAQSIKKHRLSHKP
jgi:uncharacterized protein (DUF4415 family)